MKLPFVGEIKKGIAKVRTRQKKVEVRPDVGMVQRQEKYKKMLNDKIRLRKRGSYEKK